MNVHCILCAATHTRKLFVKEGKTFLQCRACGLVWLDPMPTPADIASYYAQAYRTGAYTQFVEADAIRRLIATHRLSVVRAQARAGRWLDVGCGTGHFLAAARQAGMSAEGLDVSPEAVAQARARGLPAHSACVEDFSPRGSYDTVTAFDVIEHSLDPAGFIDRLWSWLVPDGTLVLTLPDVSSIYPRFLMGRYWFYYAPHEHLYYFNPRTLGRLLQERGFTVRSIGRAYKPLTLGHIVSQLEIFTPMLGRCARLALRPLPKRFGNRPWTCYIGEMMAVAVRAERSAVAARKSQPSCPRSST